MRVSINVVASLFRTLLTVTTIMIVTCAASIAIGLVSGHLTRENLKICLYTILIAAPLAGLFFYLSNKLGEYGLSTYLDAIYVVVLTWLISPFICMIPFILYGMSLSNSLFEVISGLTGTGLTVIPNISSAPIVIKLWRSVLQWFGEIGIVIVSIVLFARPGSPITYLYIAEGREERISVTIWRSVKIMIRIYILYTIIASILYILSGLDPFDAVCIAMTTIATGGFSPYTKPFLQIHIAHWWLFYVTCMIFMFLGAMNFRDHARLFTGRLREAFSYELKLFIAVSATFIILTSLCYLIFEKYPLALAFEVGAFHAISALTTTGFELNSLNNLHQMTKLILALAMIIGGCTCSTAGGIKVIRLATFLKNISWTVSETVKPHALVRKTVGNIKVEDRDILRTLTFILLYLTFVFISTLILVACGYTFVNSLFEVASAMGCAGLTVGVTSPVMPLPAKITLMIDMLTGRLEILPWIMFFYTILPGHRTRRRVLKAPRG